MEKQYNHDKRAFLLYEEGNEVAEIPFPYSDTNQRGHVFSEAKASGYSFFVYYRKDVPELGYHLVYAKTEKSKKKRLGWLIPMSALTTEDDDTLVKPHLNEFAFWAYCYLLDLPDIQDALNEDRELGAVLSEKYPDGNLLIIENKQIPEGKTEKSYELSLARNGYFKSASKYINPKIELVSGGDLKLIPASEVLNESGAYVNEYIEEFLAHHVYDENSFIRFFYLYQIVEVLLDAEMVELLKDFAKKLENNQATFRTADKVLQNYTEFDRFKRVVQNAGLKTEVYNSLDTACYDFLGGEPNRRLKNPESIYQVRNHIVHRFRKAVADIESVKDICDHLELYLYDLLIKYKRPNVNRI